MSILLTGEAVESVENFAYTVKRIETSLSISARDRYKFRDNPRTPCRESSSLERLLSL